MQWAGGGCLLKIIHIKKIVNMVLIKNESKNGRRRERGLDFIS